MRRGRRLIHKLGLAAYHPQKFSARGSFSKKNLDSDDHFYRPFSFMAVKGNHETNHTNSNPISSTKGKNESTNSVQKNTNPATAHCTGARRARRVDTRTGLRNALVRSCNRRSFTPEQPSQYCAAHYLPGWLARLDVQ
jgi:hypothetical protein